MRAAEPLSKAERKKKKIVKKKEAIRVKKSRGVHEKAAAKAPKRSNRGTGTKGTRPGHGPSDRKLRIQAGEKLKKGKFHSLKKYKRRK